MIRFENPPLREDIIRDLRTLAARGARVREIADTINARLDNAQLSIIPTLAYFARAFFLPLPKILPLREWIGTDNDEEIDALILPAIQEAREKWSQPEEQSVGVNE